MARQRHFHLVRREQLRQQDALDAFAVHTPKLKDTAQAGPKLSWWAQDLPDVQTNSLK